VKIKLAFEGCEDMVESELYF